jgi:hypothetical protein
MRCRLSQSPATDYGLGNALWKSNGEQFLLSQQTGLTGVPLANPMNADFA